MDKEPRLSPSIYIDDIREKLVQTQYGEIDYIERKLRILESFLDDEERAPTLIDKLRDVAEVLDDASLESSSDIVVAAITMIESLENRLELSKEDLEAVHLWLDREGVPRDDSEAQTYSIVGRIRRLLEMRANEVLQPREIIERETIERLEEAYANRWDMERYGYMKLEVHTGAIVFTNDLDCDGNVYFCPKSFQRRIDVWKSTLPRNSDEIERFAALTKKFPAPTEKTLRVAWQIAGEDEGHCLEVNGMESGIYAEDHASSNLMNSIVAGLEVLAQPSDPLMTKELERSVNFVINNPEFKNPQVKDLIGTMLAILQNRNSRFRGKVLISESMVSELLDRFKEMDRASRPDHYRGQVIQELEAALSRKI